MLRSLQLWLRDLPPMADPLERQQAPSLQAYVLSVTAAAAVWSAIPAILAPNLLTLTLGIIPPLIVMVGNLISLVLLRRGRFQAAATGSITSLLAGVAMLIWVWGFGAAQGVLPAASLALTLAGLLTGRRQLIGLGALAICYALLAWGVEQAAPDLIGFVEVPIDTSLIGAGTFGLATLIIIMLFLQFSVVVRDLLQSSMRRERELEQLRSSLEDSVAERTAALQSALTTVQQREQQLQQTLAELRSSQETIRELSSPIMPVLPGVLVAPLVGSIDSQRAAVLTNTLLERVERAGARQVIVDVTGVPVVDSQVAQVLLHTAQAVRLLGAQVLLVGIRPEVAQSLVALQTQLETLRSFPNLEEAVRTIVRERELSPAR